MNRTAITAAAGLAAALALPGCIIVDGSSGDSSANGYGSTTKAQLNSIVASNTHSRIGEPIDTVLGRFPAEHISLVHSSATPQGDSFAVYRVFAREKNRSVRFERYYVFQNDALVLLTDDEDVIETRFGSDVYQD
jgi:hypothetical protein